MTRRFILTTATLAACLASGRSLPATPSPARRPDADPSARSTQAVHPAHLLDLAGHLVAVGLSSAVQPGRPLALAVQFEAEAVPPGAVQVWIGRKNAWGAEVGRVERAPWASGFYTARVLVPADLDASRRLWLGVADGSGVLHRASLPLI